MRLSEHGWYGITPRAASLESRDQNHVPKGTVGDPAPGDSDV